MSDIDLSPIGEQLAKPLLILFAFAYGFIFLGGLIGLILARYFTKRFISNRFLRLAIQIISAAAAAFLFRFIVYALLTNHD